MTNINTIYQIQTSVIHLTSNLVDGLGESLNIARGDTGDGDTAILGGVDGVLNSLD